MFPHGGGEGGVKDMMGGLWTETWGFTSILIDFEQQNTHWNQSFGHIVWVDQDPLPAVSMSNLGGQVWPPWKLPAYILYSWEGSYSILETWSTSSVGILNDIGLRQI